jgi:glucans biosynthesis protein
VAKARAMGADIYFVDAAAVRGDAPRGLTWGKIGETPVVPDSGGRYGLSVISAVSPRGDMRFSFRAERMDSAGFIPFLKKLHKDARKPILVITDNAPSNHTKETQRVIAEQQGEILLALLPAYSPELNPDGQVWNHAKACLGKRTIFNKVGHEAPPAVGSALDAKADLAAQEFLSHTPDQVHSGGHLPNRDYYCNDYYSTMHQKLPVISMLRCCGYLTLAWLLSSQSAMAQTPMIEKPQSFDYAWLKGRARTLAGTPYVSTQRKLPDGLQHLTWDQYQQIHFNHQHALWKNSDLLFRAELSHLGWNFKTPVTIYQLENGKAPKVTYDSSLFDYGNSGVKGDRLPKDLGFAGFRFTFNTDWSRDLIAFLGASYFRAVGREMQYGLSARGLAIDVAMNEPEEFPMFTHFWLQKPTPNTDTATVYALLQSPSATGAYRIDITPGSTLSMKVDVAIYPRKPIKRLGIAPLTSMYVVGENDRRSNWDWRPEIHDSDGLAMHTGNGEWIWRPLVNPRYLRFNVHVDNNPKGFGLLQRDHNFDHYQDDGAFYDKRPSLWVEPTNTWGKGSVELVEIPTLDETLDNIVAFWKPDKPVESGQELQFSYRLFWGARPPQPTELAHVVNTFTGIGGVLGQKRRYYSKRFVIDFKGGKLPMLSQDSKVKTVISASAGRTEITSARPLRSIDGYRAMFDLVPPGGSNKPINIRLYLEKDGEPLTETWLYQWDPPPTNERQLHNIGDYPR